MGSNPAECAIPLTKPALRGLCRFCKPVAACPHYFVWCLSQPALVLMALPDWIHLPRIVALCLILQMDRRKVNHTLQGIRNENAETLSGLDYRRHPRGLPGDR
ncbi:protein of unknown function [Pseudomonas sp. JV551A1]|uniref:Uncharacterized protein n=1 Tax=Pseudomonas inefficax TaxID=2078786 RepID=A0AAQ1P3S1_9PSED|nr:protein of unknown function [Pseudomonas sp. JV551A1]SPO58631.1 protein of unknown function [Pseudomonas inefficax]